MSLAFADQTHLPIRIPQIERRPRAIAPGTPGLEFVVQDDGVAHIQFADRGLDIRSGALEAELRRVDTDDLQAPRSVLLMPAVHIGQRPSPVDTGVGAELD